MDNNFTTISAVVLFVWITILSIMAVAEPIDTNSQIITETTQTTTTATEETVESTEPTVNNSVNDVNNSVEHTEPSYTEDELEILAIIIYQESGGNAYSDDTRRKVGSVFLNRVNSDKFPNTFEGVATGVKQYGTLYLTGIKWPDRAKYSGEEQAVARAYEIAEELLVGGGVLPDNVIWQAEFLQGDGLYCKQDGIYFCYSGGIE